MAPRHRLLAAVALLTCVQSPLAAKDPLPTPATDTRLGPCDRYLLNTLYASEQTDLGLDAVVNDPAFQRLVTDRDLRLFSGPLLGCVTDHSARIWVRTPGPAYVQAVRRSGDGDGPAHTSNTVRTRADEDYSALLDLTGLAPLTTYRYDLLVDGRPVFGDRAPRFRTFPARGQAARFDIGFGGGARYVPENEGIWDTIAARHPAAFLFLGDNVYIDRPDSRTKQRVHYYRRQLRPEFRRLTAATATYAVFDDHDFGKDDCAGGLDPFRPAWKVPTWRVFRENWNNPGYGGGAAQPGCWFRFAIGDVDVFMLDNRYYRDFKQGTILGPAQKQWLLRELAASHATFKILASGVLWTEKADKGGRDSWWGVPAEREEVLSLIDRRRIGGVILLSADRHRTDVYRIERPRGYPLYEFETSKLTNLHTHPTKPGALFSYNRGTFFGLLSFDLTRPDPEVTFRCITAGNQTVYTLTLRRSQLEAPAPSDIATP